MGSRPSSFQFSTPGPLRLYSTPELLTLPPPTWLIDTILPVGAVCSMYGPPESTKSFIAIDMALCVATGAAWHSHPVQQGFVLYVAAEGGPGISKRVKAWLTAKGLPATRADVAWLIESIAVYKDSTDMETLMRRLDHEMERVPVFIVIDTLARCLEGDEVNTEDMSAFVAGLDRLRHEYGATILAIHHTNVSGGRERGNTALRGGTDTMIAVSRDDQTGPITFECSKQKDAEHFQSMSFSLELIAGSDSCVLISTESANVQRIQQILDILRTEGPLPWDSWFSSAKLSKTTFYRAFVELKKKGQIIKENGMWRGLHEGEFHDAKWHK